MTLSSRHRIRNSSPGGLRLSPLPLGHGGSPQYWLSHVDGEETFFVSFKPPRPGTEPRTLAWKAAVLTTTLGPPPWSEWFTSKTHQRDCPRDVRRAGFLSTQFHQWHNIPARRRMRRDRQCDLFQNYYIFVMCRYGLRVVPHIFHWTSRRSSRWCVDSHAIVASVVASHIGCFIVLAHSLVWFAL